MCLGSGFGCVLPLLAGVLGCACPRARSACTPPLLAGCAVWVCVFGLGFQLRPATPGWGAGVCVIVCALCLYPTTPGSGVRSRCVCLGSGFGCSPPLRTGVLRCAPLCASSACTPPLLAGVCGVGVGVWARVLVALRLIWRGCWAVRLCVRPPLVPRHSWLRCWGVRVFVCPLCLYPATPGWDVRRGCGCLGSGFGCAPPLLAGALGCACLCARSACTPPLLAGVCAVGLCAWAPDSAGLRHSWLGCWGVYVLLWALGTYPATSGWVVGVCVFLCHLRLHPATPGWGVRCGCMCLGSVIGCTQPLLARPLGRACVCLRAPLVPRHCWPGCAVSVRAVEHEFRLRPATPGWGVRCGCVCLRLVLGCTLPLLAGPLGRACVCVPAPLVPHDSWLECVVWVFLCLGSGFSCAPPLLAGVSGCLFVFLRAPPVPCHSCLGCAACVCVLGLRLRLRPATPGRGVGVCVCSCARSACTPPLLAGVLGCVRLCAGSACTPPLLAGVPGVWLGCCLAPVLVPWFIACCARCPGLSHPVAVVGCHLSKCGGCGWRACLSGVPCGPAFGRHVSSVPVALGALVGFPDAVVPFPIPGAVAPGFTGRLRGARGGRLRRVHFPVPPVFRLGTRPVHRGCFV